MYDGIEAGRAIKAGLEAIAKAIEKRQNNTYNVIINTSGDVDPVDIAARVQAALKRVER